MCVSSSSTKVPQGKGSVANRAVPNAMVVMMGWGVTAQDCGSPASPALSRWPYP